MRLRGAVVTSYFISGLIELGADNGDRKRKMMTVVKTYIDGCVSFVVAAG